MRYSSKEIKDLFIAWLIISTAFAILFSGGINLINSLDKFILSFIISAFTVGISFLLHEIMHKYFAQKYGLWAEFRASYNMLFLAIIFSFFGFIIAAPGAVFIRGYLTKNKQGKISLAGPLTNIVLALIFLIPLLFIEFQELFNLFFNYGLRINAMLALFNLLPFSIFDGRKIYLWNKKVYFITIIFAIILVFISYIL